MNGGARREKTSISWLFLGPIDLAASSTVQHAFHPHAFRNFGWHNWGRLFVLKGKSVKSREDLLLEIRIWDGLQKGLWGGDRKFPLAETVAVINVNSSSVYLGVLGVMFWGYMRDKRGQTAMRLTWAD